MIKLYGQPKTNETKINDNEGNGEIQLISWLSLSRSNQNYKDRNNHMHTSKRDLSMLSVFTFLGHNSYLYFRMTITSVFIKKKSNINPAIII